MEKAGRGVRSSHLTSPDPLSLKCSKALQSFPPQPPCSNSWVRAENGKLLENRPIIKSMKRPIELRQGLVADLPAHLVVEVDLEPLHVAVAHLHLRVRAVVLVPAAEHQAAVGL